MPVAKRAPSTNPEEIHTILGHESSFEGNLVFHGGRVRIDGKFKGEINTDSTLIVGDSAQIEGILKVGTVIITGDVNGDIIAKTSVAIEAPAKVRGKIVTPELMIQKGVLFEGTCEMESAKSGDKVTLLPTKGPDGEGK